MILKVEIPIRSREHERGARKGIPSSCKIVTVTFERSDNIRIPSIAGKDESHFLPMLPETREFLRGENCNAYS